MSWDELAHLAVLTAVFGSLLTFIQLIIWSTKTVQKGFQFFKRLEEHMLRLEKKSDLVVDLLRSIVPLMEREVNR